jgi:hypothetical protein
MTLKDEKNTLISDDGVHTNNKTYQARRFVFICNILTLALAIIGAIAFIKGNF